MKPFAPIFLAALAAASSIATSARVVEYDLRGRSDSLGEIHVGSGVELRVTRMNPVRYIYRAKTGTTAIDPVSFAEVFAFLPVELTSLGGLSSVAPAADEAIEAASAKGAIDPIQGAIENVDSEIRSVQAATRNSKLAAQSLRNSITSSTPQSVRENLGDLETKIDQLEEELMRLEQRLAELRVDLAEAERRLALAEARLKAATDVNERFQKISASLKALAVKVNAYGKGADQATAGLSEAESSLLQLYVDSNQLDKADLVVAARSWLDVLKAVPAWPSGSTAPMAAEIEQLGGELLALKSPDAAAFGLWSALDQNADAYLAAQKGLEDLADVLDAAATNKTQFAAAHGKLETEGNRLRAFSQDIDVQTYNIACSDQANRTEWTLTIQDRLPKDSGGEDAREVTVATFVCANWATISSGVLFNGLEERVYEFQPSLVQGDDGNSSENIVGLASESSFQPTLGLLANFRFAQLSPSWSLHGSVGASIDLWGEDAGEAGFLAGPSLGFRDLLYITVGPLVGRTESLTPGFSVGNPQPMGVTEVPTTKTWDVTWAIGLTFKIR
jgi:hypothetical protein